EKVVAFLKIAVGFSYMVRKISVNLSFKERLNNIINLNQNLYQAYLLKEEFRSIMNELSETERQLAIVQWIKTVMETSLDLLKKFARLLNVICRSS
ncbi:MAG: transposase, partial [Candidatus Marinimicrobia bacterium]|nr:transposase [Candidatus Neomarinimicrobiota bacterium]